MMRRVWLVVVSGLIAAQLHSGHVQAQNGARCFVETGFCIAGRIGEFWVRNGGLRVFGFPIGPERVVLVQGKPRVAQRFERSRLELWPEQAVPYDVQLGRLGDELLQQQGRDWFDFAPSQSQPACRFFPETRHNLCGAFRNAWRQYGLEFDGRAGKSERENLALFGLPLSDAQTETIGGAQILVQWFERARFELHPNNPPAYRVLFGRLGAEVAPDLESPPTATPTDIPSETPTDIPSETPTDIPSETPTAIPSETPTDIPSETPTATPIDPPTKADILLPQSDADALKEVATSSSNGFAFAELSRERTAIYALPNRGVAFMLTPTRDFVDKAYSGIDPSSLAKEPQQLENWIIGGLTVVLDQITGAIATSPANRLTPGHYILTIDRDGQQVQLTSENNKLTVPLIVRTLRQAVPRPIALISAVQNCITLAAATQFCLAIETPPAQDVVIPLKEGINALGIPESSVRIDRMTPDIEGLDAIAACREALDDTDKKPQYQDCLPTILGAPVENPDLGKRDPDALVDASIAILVALQEIRSNQFNDPNLQNAQPALPKGPWIVSAVQLPNDPIVKNDDRLRAARVRLEGPSGTTPLYLPAILGVEAIGTRFSGPDPGPPETAILAWDIDSPLGKACLFDEAKCTT